MRKKKKNENTVHITCKFQTDHLEVRFGQYQWLSENQYISLNTASVWVWGGKPPTKTKKIGKEIKILSASKLS